MKSKAVKLLCLAAVLCMLLTFTACGTAGTYVLSELEFSGIKYDADDLEELGLDAGDCYIKLNSDGTGTLCLFGECEAIQWEDDRFWLTGEEDDPVPFELDGSRLTIEYEGESLTFTKE